MPDIESSKITVTRDGPYFVSGPVPVGLQVIETDSEGGSRAWREGQAIATEEYYQLCRCGRSSQKPFCDGTHRRVRFDGTETATRDPYIEQAEIFDGPEMTLTDAEALCAYARFCDPDGRIWNLIEQTDSEDARQKVEHEAGHCPGGRLVAWHKSTNQPFEPELAKSIGLVQDPKEGVSGPLWVRGGIPVESADGTPYEVRNRVALCRCGASGNKPFCDGSHVSVEFQDGLYTPGAELS